VNEVAQLKSDLKDFDANLRDDVQISDLALRETLTQQKIASEEFAHKCWKRAEQGLHTLDRAHRALRLEFGECSEETRRRLDTNTAQIDSHGVRLERLQMRLMEIESQHVEKKQQFDDEIARAMKRHSETDMKGFLGYT